MRCLQPGTGSVWVPAVGCSACFSCGDKENFMWDCILLWGLKNAAGLRILSVLYCLRLFLFPVWLLFGQRGGNSTTVQLLTALRGQDTVFTRTSSLLLSITRESFSSYSLCCVVEGQSETTRVLYYTVFGTLLDINFDIERFAKMSNATQMDSV